MIRGAIASAVVMAVLTVSTLRAAPPAPPPDAPAAASPFTVRPQSFQSNCFVNFGEDGRPQNTSFNCSLGLVISHDHTVNVTSYKDIRVTQIVTDTGANLQPVDSNMMGQPFFNRVNRFNNGMFNNGVAMNAGRPQFMINVQLPFPPVNAKKLAIVAGQMTVQIAVGPVRQVQFPSMKDVAGKHVRIQGLANDVSVVIYNDRHEGRARVELPQPAAALMTEVRFTDAAGRNIPTNEAGSGFNGTTYTQYYAGTIPDDAKATLSFYDHIDNKDVKFVVRDIPLPQPAPAKEDEVVLHAEPAPAEAPQATRPANDAAALKAVVE
jgi:hypothetical protein